MSRVVTVCGVSHPYCPFEVQAFTTLEPGAHSNSYRLEAGNSPWQWGPPRRREVRLYAEPKLGIDNDLVNEITSGPALWLKAFRLSRQ